MSLINYIVSDLKPVKSPAKSFFHSHYCAHRYGISANSKNVAKYIDTNKDDLQHLWNCSETKYKKYVDILGHRLNDIHGTNYSDEFWKRVFSQGLLTYITALHQFYIYANENFNPSIHTCELLSEKSFHITNKFEELKDLLTSSDFGQEQLFSLYIKFFYSGNYPEFDFQIDNINLKKKNISLIKKFLNLKNYSIKSILNKIQNLIFKFKNLKSNAVVGIMGSYFEKNHLSYLIEKSSTKIQTIPVLELPERNHVDFNKRDLISKTNQEMDDFDKFFFFTLKFLLPKYLLENFFPSIDNLKNNLKDYPKLKFIISEGWLGSSSINLFRALAFEESEVKTYYNEHNCFFHPYVGDMVNFQSDLVDKYLTLGWDCESLKFKKTASLFPFTIPLKEKKYDILYVNYPSEPFYEFYSSSYMSSGSKALKQLEFVNKFFKNIPNNTLKKIFYRSYPRDYFRYGFRYQNELMSHNYLDYVNHVSSFKSKGETCKEQMASSSLVIIDQLSTGYLESLLMNIPTICLIDHECLLLNEKYPNFFDDLIEANIIHTNPESASKHFETVHLNPLKWWDKDKTQKLKNRWLSRNFGDPKVMTDYLLQLAKNN